mmetsp:Transcript_147351/g.473490  ORF Transcript_147351/g.473490 Transcript_147351/m.473490 type:complete len:216 (-) Transcript_147351:650-1297(-)
MQRPRSPVEPCLSFYFRLEPLDLLPSFFGEVSSEGCTAEPCGMQPWLDDEAVAHSPLLFGEPPPPPALLPPTLLDEEATSRLPLLFGDLPLVLDGDSRRRPGHCRANPAGRVLPLCTDPLPPLPSELSVARALCLPGAGGLPLSDPLPPFPSGLSVPRMLWPAGSGSPASRADICRTSARIRSSSAMRSPAEAMESRKARSIMSSSSASKSVTTA